MAKIIYTILLSVLLTFMFGCGPGSGNASPQVPTAPIITTQPASQTVAIGQVVTFTVAASGTAPLTYQWFWNGMALNARDASFTTPPAISSDNQSTFAVTVTNQVGTVLSMVATLSVPGSPRRPDTGDLRFKDVGTFPLPLIPDSYRNIPGRWTISFPNRVGTPLEIGYPGPTLPDGNPRNTSWFFGTFFLPDGAVSRTTRYQAGVLSDFPSDLASLEGPSTVITSLDLSAVQNAYALQAIKTAGSDAYTFGSETLLPGDFQAAATQQGLASRVITAVSLNGGRATFISYGRQGDTSTIYESSALPATINTVSSVASGLAQKGYIITAVGGNVTDGFLLVGTRVQGDTTPRPFKATTRMVNDRGYTLVGMIFLYDASTSTSSDLYFYEQ